MPSQQTLYPTIIQSIINNLQAWFQNVKFNVLNTATGTTTCISNTTTGILTYTGTISSSATASLVLTNSLITSASIIEWYIVYPNSTSAILTPCFYIPTAGSVTFVLKNLIASATNANVIINYTIIA